MLSPTSTHHARHEHESDPYGGLGEQQATAFRRVIAHDLALLEHWFRYPHVHRYYGADDGWGQRIRNALNATEITTLAPYMIEIPAHHRRPIGYIQRHLVRPLSTRRDAVAPAGVWACELFIGAVDLLGRGYGSRALRGFAAWCDGDPNIGRLSCNPDPTHAAAIACCRRAGFQPHPDGWWRWTGADAIG